jgi:hypothetical protein
MVLVFRPSSTKYQFHNYVGFRYSNVTSGQKGEFGAPFLGAGQQP